MDILKFFGANMKTSKILEFLRFYGINAIEEYERLKTAKIGLIVNPIAGMGGRVGLKGTDNKYELALKLGAKPVAPKRAVEFLKCLMKGVEIYTYPKYMGEYEAIEAGFKPNVLGEIGDRTTAEDTKKAARDLVKIVDLIVFVGGDGTARDICEVVGDKIPVIGVPAGVKMYSAVFALNPRVCAKIVNEFVRGKTSLELREVMDADESLIDKKISIKLFGYLKVPVISNLVQRVKRMSSGNLDGLVINFLRIYDKNRVYVFGPGGTTYQIVKALGLEKTLLGVDIVYEGRLIVKDAKESDILKVIDEYGDVTIVVTPIGGQGFVFGRGNLQISPEVLKRIKKENILIVSTTDKLNGLDCLRVDVDDANEILEGEVKVLTEVGFVKFKIKADF